MNLVIITLLSSLYVSAYGGGEVIFLSKPPSIEFRGHEECDSNIVKDILLTSLGFTQYSQTNDWPGLYIHSPFNFARSVVVVNVEGISSLNSSQGHKFPFNPDSSMEDIWMNLETKILERYPYSERQSFMEINLDEGVRAAEINLNKGNLILKKLNATYLNDEEDEDSTLINQLALFRALLEKIAEKGVIDDGLPEVYIITLRGLHPIVDIYGEDSSMAMEAKELTTSLIEHTKKVFEKACKDKMLLMVLTSDVAHTRRVRRSPELVTDRNLAPVYDENYPVFFNIFLWFTIAFIMAIIATSMVTAFMDPGRDSIIYRMTSTRMKKDN